MRYYFYEKNVATGIYSGKYIRFEDLNSEPSHTDSLDWVTSPAPPIFLPPFCPYWNGSAWVLKKGPQKYYQVANTVTSLAVQENSIYEFSGSISSLTFNSVPSYLQESSVFFTLNNPPTTGAITFPVGSKVVGSRDYWKNGESYIITVYNNYYIIGVSKNGQ